MRYLIYVVFGADKGRCRSELVYSLLSLDKMAGGRPMDDTRVLIYTDEELHLPDCLGSLPLIFRFLDRRVIADWIARGNGHYLIVKARVMLDFLQNYQGSGILVDTDTFFIRDPANLFASIAGDHLLMHLKEYPFTNRPDIHSFFMEREFRQLNGTRYTIPSSFHMWNSGVVGIHKGYIDLLPEIIFLIEQIASDGRWPHEERKLIEQTAYSYYLQSQGSRLIPAEHAIIHYWFFKEFRYLLGKYFGFFHEEDGTAFENLMADLKAEDWDFSELRFEDLPALMFRLMQIYGMLRDYHFECLPEDTFVGNVLRSI